MKIAILGTWHVHAGAYTADAKKYGEVIGVYDDNSEWKRNFATNYDIPQFDSIEQLLASDAESIIVNTATNRHADDIVKIAESGKNIFTEKVLALSLEDCERVKRAVEKNKVRFVISFPQRTTAGPLTLKAIADSGEIGDINYIRFRNCHSGSLAHWLPAHFYNREECGGGAMIDLGAHGMYLINWFLGEPETYRSVFTHVCRDEKDAILNPDAVEDNAVTVMSYKNGAIALNETGFVTIGCPMTMEIGGSAGYAVFTEGKDTVTVSVKSGKKEISMCEPHDLPIISFLKGLTPEGCGINEAITLTKMMLGAYKN